MLLLIIVVIHDTLEVTSRVVVAVLMLEVALGERGLLLNDVTFEVAPGKEYPFSAMFCTRLPSARRASALGEYSSTSIARDACPSAAIVNAQTGMREVTLGGHEADAIALNLNECKMC